MNTYDKIAIIFGLLTGCFLLAIMFRKPLRMGSLLFKSVRAEYRSQIDAADKKLALAAFVSFVIFLFCVANA